MENEEIMTEATEELVESVAGQPVANQSSGLKTLAGGAALAVGGVALGAKISQKVYTRHYEKRGMTPPVREKWYQIWRKKAKKATNESSEPVDGVIREVDPEEE